MGNQPSNERKRAISGLHSAGNSTQPAAEEDHGGVQSSCFIRASRFIFTLGLFTSSPEIRSLFPTLVDWGDDIKTCQKFRNQGLKFVHVISLSLTTLHDKEHLDTLLKEIGTRHVEFMPGGIKMEYWDIFEKAMVKCILQQIRWTDDFDEAIQSKAAIAWRILCAYIVQKIKIGFTEALELSQQPEVVVTES
ncbi:unnamed protein product [Soboliphyme baturini]|uniref:GLOBIN domain-containing protein n=1 Tax=Soboliphyme baturini TaxID=241478 RepID=A0A183IYP9_9BILA|nr:unnamed protein product [Soboliphyme baturini]